MQRSSILIWFCCVIFISTLLSPAFGEDNTPIKKIRVAYNIGNPPIKFSNRGKPDGIMIDIWKLWSEKTGIRVEFKEAIFNRTLQMVENGDADVHGGLFYTEARDQVFDYTVPILDIDYMIFFHESVTGINSLKDLASFRIGVPEGYTHTFVKNNIPDAAISVYRNFPELYDAALKGEVRVFLSPVINHQYYFQSRNIPSPFLYNTSRPAYTQTYFGAVRQGDTELREIINRGFEKIRQDELVDIQRRWLKGNPKISSRKKYIIACNSRQAPLSMINTLGQPTGFYIDIWRLWAQKINADVSFLFNSHEGSLQDLENGIADFHAGLSTSATQYLSSNPYYKIPVKIFVPGHKLYRSVSDLSGATIGYIDETYGDALRKANPAVRTIRRKDYNEIFNQLIKGDLDGFVANQIVAEDLLYRQGRKGEFKELADFSHESFMAAALAPKNRYLQDMINHGLSLITEQEFRDIEKKWFTQTAHPFFSSYFDRVLLNKEERQWLDQHRVIKVGIDPEYQPFEFLDKDGEYRGIAADYMHLLEKKLHVRFEIVKDASWQKVMEMARNRNLDMVAAANQTEERSRFLTFTKPYIKYPVVAVTRQSTPIYDGLDDLTGKKVAVVKDYAYTELLLGAVPDIRRIDVDTVAQGLQHVAQGKADAIVGDLASLAYQIQKFNLINLKINTRINLPAKGLAIGVRKDYPIFAGILEKALSSISEDEHIRIRRKWSVLEIPGETDHTPKAKSPAAIALTPLEKKFIKDHPLITIGIDPMFIPFEYVDEKGLYAGISSDYVKLLNKRLGINLQVVQDLSWSQAFQKARNGEIDVLPCVGVTRERLALFNYSQPYISRFVVIVTRRDGPMILQLSDLSGKKVAVERNTFHEGFVKEKTNIQPHAYPTMKKALVAVSSAKADAFIGDVAASSYWIKKMHLTNLKIAGPADFAPQTLHFAVQKKYPELISIINKGLESISDEEKTQIRNRWISIEYEPGVDPAVFWRYFSIAAFTGIILLTIFLLWNYSLKKEITVRKKAEKQIALYAEELKEANLNLETLDKLKSMFIASMSHELRTPLNSIIGFTGVILQGMSGEINEQQKDQLNRVYTSAKHLLDLISDVIDISKIEAGRIDVFPETFNLSELLDEAILNIQPQLAVKSMDIITPETADIQVTTDRKRLLQCLINYLSNAVKYSEHGSVTVTVDTFENEVEIKVTDTGIGIPDEEQPKLFHAFERINSRLKVKAGGTGLGLYLTRKLAVDLLQGSVSVESQPGKGSTFGIRFAKHLKPVAKGNIDYESLDH